MSKAGAILQAEDDENDAFLFRRALLKVGVQNPLTQVPNGEAAVHYLNGVGEYSDREKFPFPGLLITDLKMPVFSGFDLLAEIKPLLDSRELRAIILTASVADSDRERSLQLGAHAYFVKPSNLSGLVTLAAQLKEAWIPAVALPV